MEELDLTLKELAFHLIEKDTSYIKIDKKKQIDLINFAISIGQNQAWKYISEGLDPYQPISYINRHCRIDLMEKSAAIAIYSEFAVKDNKITIYLQELDEIIEENKEDINKERLINVFLLHEFFHFIEYNFTGPVSRMRKITVCKFLFLKIKRGMPSLSEIAAHSFVREVVGDPLLYLRSDSIDERSVNIAGN